MALNFESGSGGIKFGRDGKRHVFPSYNLLEDYNEMDLKMVYTTMLISSISNFT